MKRILLNFEIFDSDFYRLIVFSSEFWKKRPKIRFTFSGFEEVKKKFANFCRLGVGCLSKSLVAISTNLT